MREYPIVFGQGMQYAEFQHHKLEILQQIQLLLLGFGIKGNLVTDKAGLLHHLMVPATERFRQLIENELFVAVPNSYRETDGFDSLELIGEEAVFDLTEPVTSHFVANGLVVHNCSEYMFLDDTACNLASINLMKFRLRMACLTSSGSKPLAGSTSSPRKSWWTTPAIRRHRLPRTATCSGRSDWGIPTSAA